MSYGKQIDMSIRKTTQTSINLVIEVGAQFSDAATAHNSELLRDIDVIGGSDGAAKASIEYDEERSLTIIKVVVINPSGASSYSHRQYIDIALRLASELKVEARDVRLSVAFSIIETLDKFDDWLPGASASPLAGMTRGFELSTTSEIPSLSSEPTLRILQSAAS